MEHQALLAATRINWEWEMISGIKCRLCPDTKFKKWEDFKRHCDTMEAHPSKNSFGNIRGDFFARSDSLERYRKTPPPMCISVTLEEAAEKRSLRETQKAHEEFEVRLVTGEDIGKPFSRIIKEMYPESSKKHIGGQ